MTGLQITINDSVIINSASELSISVFFFPRDGFFSITGIDIHENGVRWQNQPIKVGDNIKIRVKELDSITEPTEIRPVDLDSLKGKYLILREELKKKGLI